MSENTRKEYNEWYWNIMVQTALQRIITICKSTDRDFTLTANKKDFFTLIKYLATWENNHPTMAEAEGVKRDLWIVRNFEGYEEAIAA
ncbi:MAG: hypothetical protein WCL02_02850 [bacterium]